MQHDPARNPSELRARAKAHRAMAMAALHSDSSNAVRTRRYKEHMAKAHELEAEADRLESKFTSDPRLALAWLKAGLKIRINSLDLRDHLRHVRALAAIEQGGAQ